MNNKYIIYRTHVDDSWTPPFYDPDKRLRGVRNAISMIAVDRITAVHETLTGVIIMTTTGKYEIAIHEDDISAAVKKLVDFIINSEDKSYTIH